MNSRLQWSLTTLVLIAAALLWQTALIHAIQPDDRPSRTAPAGEAAPAIPVPDFAGAETFLVAGANDGDTLNIFRNGAMEKVRLIGVDTPETMDPRKPVQFYGQEATDFTGNLVTGERVYLKFERDGAKDLYGRTLAHVYRAPDGLWVNLEIVRQGYGQVYSAEAFQEIDLFLAYQRRAREAGKGLWNANRKADWTVDRARCSPL